jgi:hypothetical protein
MKHTAASLEVCTVVELRILFYVDLLEILTFEDKGTMFL